MRRTEDSAHVTQRTTYNVRCTAPCATCGALWTESIDSVPLSCHALAEVSTGYSRRNRSIVAILTGTWRHCLARQGRIDFKEFAVGMSTIRKETIDQKLEMICARLEFTVQRAIVQHRIVYNATLERLWPRCIMPTCSPKHSQS